MSVGTPSDPLKFAYWVPNVSGGLVTSGIEQRTDWNWDYNRETAIAAENNGFEYALSPGPVHGQLLAPSTSTSRRRSRWRSCSPPSGSRSWPRCTRGMWHPGVFANFGATADHLTNGRFATNVVSRLVQGRVHRVRGAVARARRALPAHRGVHPLPARASGKTDHFEFHGDFYRFHDYSLKPKPLNTPERPHPDDLPGRQLHGARRRWPAGSRTTTSPTARTSTASPSSSTSSTPRPPSTTAP